MTDWSVRHCVDCGEYKYVEEGLCRGCQHEDGEENKFGWCPDEVYTNIKNVEGTTYIHSASDLSNLLKKVRRNPHPLLFVGHKEPETDIEDDLDDVDVDATEICLELDGLEPTFEIGDELVETYDGSRAEVVDIDVQNERVVYTILEEWNGTQIEQTYPEDALEHSHEKLSDQEGDSL